MFVYLCYFKYKLSMHTFGVYNYQILIKYTNIDNNFKLCSMNSQITLIIQTTITYKFNFFSSSSIDSFEIVFYANFILFMARKKSQYILACI